jgi:exonuclease VII small subunit
MVILVSQAACTDVAFRANAPTEETPETVALSEANALWKSGRKMVTDGEKTIAGGRKLIRQGREDVRKGEAQIEEGLRLVAASRSTLDEAIVDDTRIGANDRPLEKGARLIRSGNELVEQGKQRIDQGRIEIREGRLSIDAGLSVMQSIEQIYAK